MGRRSWIFCSLALVVSLLLAMGATPAAALYESRLVWAETGTGDGQLDQPEAMAIDDMGNVYVADTDNDRIQVFSPSGTFLRKFGSSGSADGQLNGPDGIAVGPDGLVYVADVFNDRVQVFTQFGTFVRKWGGFGAGNGQFSSPTAITFDSAGDVYVGERFNYRVQKFTRMGVFLGKWGSNGTGDGEFTSISDVTVAPNGSVLVLDDSRMVQEFTPTGTFITRWGEQGSNPGQLLLPQGIDTDDAGNIYVADSNHRVQKFTRTGVVQAALPVTLGSSFPSDVVIDDERGVVHVLHRLPPRVERLRAVLPNTSVAGPSGLIKDPTPTFTLTSSINPATFECRVKGSGVPFAPCTSPYTTPELDDGLNVVLVRAVDAHNLKDATPFEAEFRVDATKPLTFLDAGPASTTRDRTPTFAFSSNERGTFQCSLDGGAFTACTSPRTTSLLSFAKHTFRVRARDRAGNIDSTPATRTFTVTR